MNFQLSPRKESRRENYTHSSKLRGHREKRRHNIVVLVSRFFTSTVKQEVIKRVAEPVCKDGLQVPLHIES